MDRFAEHLGYSRVALVGHSAGWASIGRYQADSKDQRVAGLVFASPAVGPSTVADDPQLLAQAKKLVDEGAGDDLLRLPNRSFPSFISAATHMDSITTPGDHAGNVSDHGLLRIERRHCWREGAQSTEVVCAAPFPGSAQSRDSNDCERGP